jgi:hypothetical protein
MTTATQSAVFWWAFMVRETAQRRAASAIRQIAAARFPIGNNRSWRLTKQRSWKAAMSGFSIRRSLEIDGARVARTDSLDLVRIRKMCRFRNNTRSLLDPLGPFLAGYRP